MILVLPRNGGKECGKLSEEQKGVHFEGYSVLFTSLNKILKFSVLMK